MAYQDYVQNYLNTLDRGTTERRIADYIRTVAPAALMDTATMMTVQQRVDHEREHRVAAQKERDEAVRERDEARREAEDLRAELAVLRVGIATQRDRAAHYEKCATGALDMIRGMAGCPTCGRNIAGVKPCSDCPRTAAAKLRAALNNAPGVALDTPADAAP